MSGSEPEVTTFDRKSHESGCRRLKSEVLGTFELLQGSNSQEVAVMSQESRLHVTGSDPEVTSFQRQLFGSGCRRPVSQVLGTFDSYRAPTRRRWQSRDKK